MKILMVIDSMVRGGSERRLTELLKSITKLDEFRVELAILSDRVEFNELYDLDLPIHIIERKPKRSPAVFLRFYNLCKEIKPDIIHAWGSLSAIVSLPAKWFGHAFFINAMITDAPSILSLLDQRLLRFRITAPSSDLILSNSRAGLKAYRAPESKSLHIYNGFDFDRFNLTAKPEDIRQKYEIPPLKIVAMVGAVAPRKDFHSFIKIANIVLSKRRDTIFLVVGDGPLLPACKTQVLEENKDRVIFSGKVSEVENLIRVIDIGMLISNPQLHGEGISNVIMEYMAAGKPVIANDNGGNNEIIQSGDTGYIIDSDAPIETYIEKVNYLLDHAEVRASMGRNGKERIEKQFGINKMVDNFISLYREQGQRKN